MSDDDIQLELISEPSTPARTVAKSFEAARLTQARVLRGLTKAALADLVGVTPAAIGQFEARITTPRAELLTKLALELDVPVEFFATGRPMAELDAAEAHFRSLRSTRASDRARAASFVEQVWELSFALEKRVQFPEIDLPEITPGTEPAEAARALRAAWGISPGPLPHLVATIESRGVIVSILSLASQEVARVDAFSTSSLGRPIIVVTPERAQNVYRHRFTCAHELGHLLLHSDAAPGDLSQEREADAFAAEFLCPADQIGPSLPSSMNLPSLERLSRRWGVSTQSLVRRMGELRTVSDSSVRRAYQRLRSVESLASDEPVSAYKGEMPSLLREAYKIAGEHGLSLADLARDLRWQPRRVTEVLGMEDPRPALKLV
ncbi:XRE family transcriptional regulator [Aeromicrobium wangtongii]|uniref:XRE family transcriptional regulator n=1 Tax=Aeromicrobium wangtongii TaxID=2969247 RepID=A0ABY5MA16_9ACTN|nr:XRE family transcriptional regulator [Aeromicrobium wangtongii]MCD9197471.1 XRE family transcriptional regulator [Aeromicrobium wangtongii]UUP14963.1 XRE family transcriptional regulator [Aeromicrobium wangtongii]